ncbi:MAG: molybdopterin oxidoreductase family protein [Stagnimonas sp.]|nr:molybdopterin oxidoreductase family protein [Stagnimonas sp.]
MSEPATQPAERVHFGACNLCEAICGLEFKVRGNEILQIKGDAADPLSRGHICPKAVALKDIYEDPDRLRKPMQRIGDQWQEIEWDAAFDWVATKLAEAHLRDPDSVAAYLGNPSVHNYGVMTTSGQMLSPIRTRNRYSATSVDQLPHQLMAYWMYGHQLLVPISDIDRTQYFLVLGANPMASNGSLMTVPDFRHRLKALHARGGKMVVIDPRRSETAEVADAHHFIRPGTDAAFLLGLLKVMLDENLLKPGRLAGFTDGLDEALDAIRPFELAVLAAHCGIAAEHIQTIARDFAAADGAACYGRMGVSVQAYGSLSQWLIQLINIATGNLDREGGMLFTEPALDLIQGAAASKPGSFGKIRTRVRGLPEFGGELPVVALAEEIETPGAGQVRALVTIAGNPVLSTPNGRKLDAALASLDFMVSVDIYLNETTRHAHVILPPTCALEHEHYDLIFHHFAVHNTARLSAPLFDKAEGTMHDWEIFQAVGKRLAEKLGQPARPMPRPQQIVDMGLQASPRKLSVKTLQSHPHGMDLGALKPTLPERLVHASKRINAAPEAIFAELARFAATLNEAAPTSQQLKLIGRRHVRSNNSWMHNSHRLVKGNARHQLLMHPDDVASRGLADGSTVRVRSRVGEIRVEVQASAEMMPGVVSLPHGWGHNRTGTRLGIAEAHPGASNNDLTDELFLDVLSGNAALNGVPVEVLAA